MQLATPPEIAARTIGTLRIHGLQGAILHVVQKSLPRMK